MLGSGEISERASVAPLLAAKAGSNLGDLQNGRGIVWKYPMPTAERFWSGWRFVALTALDTRGHLTSPHLCKHL